MLFQDLPDDVKSIADIPEDFLPSRPLGTHAAVVAAIRAVAPTTDLSDPTWGIHDGARYSIEFNIGNADPVYSMMLHIRGDDEATVLRIVRDLSLALDRRAIDCATGELLDHAATDPAAGFRAWRNYRDKIVT